MLLDTHVWLWSVEGSTRRIGRRARRALDRAHALQSLRVSPASVFELTAKHTSGQIGMTRPIEEWVRESFERGGLRLAELTVSIAIDAGSIPTTALPDPIDRLLVATARSLDLPLITRDTRILEYADRTGLVRVQDAAA